MITSTEDVELVARALKGFKDKILNGRLTHIKLPNRLAPSAEAMVERIDQMLSELEEMEFGDDQPDE